MTFGKVAIVSLTKHSTEKARALQGKLEGSTLHAPSKFAAEAGEGALLFESVKERLASLFPEVDGLVLFFSTGAAVRVLAPLLRDKKTDPAVVVVDDLGRFAISLLSGHLGGANDLAQEVATALGATPVITTASDVNETLAVDILGREFGWTLEPETNVTRISAIVVNAGSIALVQETGEKGWWTRKGPLPANIHRFASLEEVEGQEFEAYLLVTDRIPTGRFWEERAPRTLFYRPKSLALGLGCDRATEPGEVRDLVQETLKQRRLSPNSVRGVATISLKQHEPALKELAAQFGVPLTLFSQEELNAVPGIENPSEVVYRYVRTYGVAEPSALRLAGAEHLLVPKVKSRKATLAVARYSFSEEKAHGVG